MNTPEAVRQSLGLPHDSYPGAALVPVEYENSDITSFHSRAGICVVAILRWGKNSTEEAEQIVTLQSTSAFHEAMKTIISDEEEGLIEPGSAQSAMAALHQATFERSVWAMYLQSESGDE